MKILLADPDEQFAALTAYALRRQGHETTTATEVEEAWRRWSREQPEMILLDPALPRGDAFELLRRIREASSVPIVILSPLSNDADFIRAYESGIDDYIVKPFSIRQLTVRIQALVRRMGKTLDIETPVGGESLALADITINLPAFEVFKNGGRVALTRLEMRILYCLALREGHLVETQRLADYSWGTAGVGDARLLKTHICHIRAKLEQAGGRPCEIRAIPRGGYILSTVAEPLKSDAVVSTSQQLPAASLDGQQCSSAYRLHSLGNEPLEGCHVATFGERTGQQ